jgi:hypothetical protein
MLRRIFGPKEERVTLHNQEIHNLYPPTNIKIRVIKLRRSEMDWMISTYGDERNVYTVLVTEQGWVSSFGRRRWRWVNNIKINLREVGH